ncbi:MAG: DNA alkylation repair protein, partial [Pseudomonadota bacterium]
LKDQLFNADTVAELSSAVKAAYPKFKQRAFDQEVLQAFPELELKARINCLVETLHKHLPDNFNQAVKILNKTMPPPLDPKLTDDDFGHFIWSVPAEYVARYGCSKQHLSTSLKFLREATMRFSAENAIRPFLRQFLKPTMAFIHECAEHNNYHVRRLASEGIRPLLPWAPRANVPVADIIEVLDRLYADPTRYVVRSVANTLNDIAKDEPQLVLDTLQRWRQNKQANTDELAWLTRHALRTLLKSDHPAALSLLGYADPPRFSVSKLKSSANLRVGEAYRWRCEFKSSVAQKLKINLRIHYLRANGTHSAKVFVVKDGEFAAGELLLIDKQQPFRPMTTRTLYPGTHYAELTVNGTVWKKRRFILEA